MNTKGNIIAIGSVCTGKTVSIKSMIKQARVNGERAVIYDYQGDFVKEYYKQSSDIVFDPEDNKIEAWLESVSGFIFVSDPEHIELIVKILLSQPDDITRNIWLFFDEFEQLPASSSVIPELLSSGRRKGVKTVIMLSNLQPLTDKYNKEMAQTIINDCQTKMVFRQNSLSDAEYFSKVCGSVVEDAMSYSGTDFGGGISFFKRERKLVLPSEIMNLPNLCCFLKIEGQDVIKEKLQIS